MEITSTSEFLHRNKLRQSELAEYLGVTSATVSRYVNGSLEIPVKNVTQIINNPYGWDTSMFTTVNSTTISSKATGNSSSSITIGTGNNCNRESDRILIESLQKEILSLRELLDEEKKRSAQYWEMIISLTKR